MTFRDSAPCTPAHSDVPRDVWVGTTEPTATQLHAMKQTCRSCPVFDACALDMSERRDHVGFRAGVMWTNNLERRATTRRRYSTTLGHLRICGHCRRPYTPDSPGRSDYCSLDCRRDARHAQDRDRKHTQYHGGGAA